MTLMEPQDRYIDDLLRRFEIELKYDLSVEILKEEENLKYFKNMSLKHCFGKSSYVWLELYNNLKIYIDLLKFQYKERYAARNTECWKFN